MLPHHKGGGLQCLHRSLSADCSNGGTNLQEPCLIGPVMSSALEPKDCLARLAMGGAASSDGVHLCVGRILDILNSGNDLKGCRALGIDALQDAYDGLLCCVGWSRKLCSAAAR